MSGYYQPQRVLKRLLRSNFHDLVSLRSQIAIERSEFARLRFPRDAAPRGNIRDRPLDLRVVLVPSVTLHKVD
jgi:hypothetical protein